MNYVFNLATGESVEEYISRCGTDRCNTCGKDVPKGWGIDYGTKFECIRCEEASAEAQEEGR